MIDVQAQMEAVKIRALWESLLDWLVADKFMGWETTHYQDRPERWFYNTYRDKPDTRVEDYAFHPAGRAECAMEVMTKLKREGWTVNLYGQSDIPPMEQYEGSKGYWHFSADRERADVDKPHKFPHICFQAETDHPWHAVCIVALKIEGVIEDENG